ncbi:hypothetical protein H4582DRAFT_2060608 [Lactarius indigo]|nr:hypothetical protein H4582DRAFT_2060608 [Lactarius indigo]
MATSNALLKTTLTASTQLFATPRRVSQFRVAQVRVKARPCAERYLRGKNRRAPGTAPKRERRDLNLSKGVWKSVHDNTSQLEETGRRGHGCITKDGNVCLICGSASAAASGRPEVWEGIGDHGSQLGVGGCTRRGSQDPAEKPPQGPPPSDALSPVPLGSQATPSHTTQHCSDAAMFIPIACFPPCRLSNVQERFQAPILAPLQQPLVVERSIGNEAAHGEQIQQKGHRVEQAQVGSKPWLPRIRGGGLVPKNTGISPLATKVAGAGGVQGLDARKTDRAAPGNWDHVKAICA